MINISKLRDLTGQQFGRLTVIKRVEDKVQENGRRRVQWLCQCNCENQTMIVVRGENLKNGSTKSCGCLAKEVRSKIHKKYNQYDLSGEYGIGWTSNTNEEFYFDLEDYNKIKNYC